MPWKPRHSRKYAHFTGNSLSLQRQFTYRAKRVETFFLGRRPLSDLREARTLPIWPTVVGFAAGCVVYQLVLLVVLVIF